MTQLELSLEFACQACEGSVGITVQCRGRGLDQDSEAVARVRVPCPNCGCISAVSFRPATGELLESTPIDLPWFAPLASIN
jgi:hypothetical protein